MVNIYDNTGTLVYINVMDAGEYIKVLDLSRLQNGTYYVVINNNLMNKVVIAGN